MTMKPEGILMMKDGHWMQTEVEWISTEQQRQGVEITGLRSDVLRGNRINEDNNQMLRNIMQHLHLQGPPYGPQ